MIDKTQNLIKQIHDCCAWFPASKALSAVPVDIQLQAATKVGLVKQGAIKFCSDMIEYFLAECFVLLAQRLQRIEQGWFKVIEKELSNYGIAAELEDTEAKAKAKLELAMGLYCVLPREETRFHADDML